MNIAKIENLRKHNFIKSLLLQYFMAFIIRNLPHCIKNFFKVLSQKFFKGTKMKTKLLGKFLAVFVALQTFLFAKGNTNIADKLATDINAEIENVGSSIASVVNTISATLGIIWIVIMLLMAFFAMEQIKQHAKLLVGALIVIGAVYGLSSAMM